MKLLTVISSILLSKAGGKGGKSNADFIYFFLNDAKCGRSASGSRHSVTPQRHKKMLPAAARCLFQDQGQRQSSAEPLGAEASLVETTRGPLRQPCTVKVKPL